MRLLHQFGDSQRMSGSASWRTYIYDRGSRLVATLRAKTADPSARSQIISAGVPDILAISATHPRPIQYAAASPSTRTNLARKRRIVFYQ